MEAKDGDRRFMGQRLIMPCCDMIEIPLLEWVSSLGSGEKFRWLGVCRSGPVRRLRYVYMYQGARGGATCQEEER
jgi:hypothetical protein